jgi:acyl dehydratase
MNLDSVGTSSEPVERSWTSTDCILYALGVGAGSIDANGFELAFTTENSAGVAQQVLPTFATIVGAANRAAAGGAGRGGIESGGRMVEFSFGSFDPAMLVHGEQAIELFGPIPAEGSARTTSTITGIYDKGSGAVVVMKAASVDAANGAPIFTTETSLFIRGEGGFGGPREREGSPPPIPERKPDELVTYDTRRDQALLYRLSGDRNPLHSDPAFAERAGFERPILHGLCTYGFTGRALLHQLCGSDPGRFGSMSGRFTKPVMPGDTLGVSIWHEDGGARFRTTTSDGVVAIDSGAFSYSAST